MTCAIFANYFCVVTDLPNSTSRGLHFWEVVPLDVLLEQLSNGSGGADGNVAQKLHQLLVPSYFPDSQEGAVSVRVISPPL